MEETRISVNGDPEAGWIVDVHDGDRHGTYSPDGKNATEVIAKALKMHAGDDKDDKPAPAAASRPPADKGKKD